MEFNLALDTGGYVRLLLFFQKIPFIKHSKYELSTHEITRIS